MHIPTIFDIKYESGLTKYTIEEEKLHHLSHVLRIKNESYVKVTNGRGIISLGKILNSQIIILETEANERTTELNIFISKLQDKTRMRFLVEKLTELGIKSITIGPTENSQKVKFMDSRGSRTVRHILCARSDNRR